MLAMYKKEQKDEIVTWQCMGLKQMTTEDTTNGPEELLGLAKIYH